jgi:beta-galactosidase/beta-glucuronidase
VKASSTRNPHGKQNWYVETSGLWQDVSLDIRPRMHLGAVHITAGMDGKFKIQAAVNNVTVDLPIAETLRVKAVMADPDGKEAWSGAAELKRDQSSYEIAGSIANPRLWWTHNPALYTLHVSLPTGDSRDYRFGFRTFETRAGKFYLNGHVIYLRAPLDQDFYPDTIYTPPSYEYLRAEMQQAKAFGFNMMRPSRCRTRAIWKLRTKWAS